MRTFNPLALSSKFAICGLPIRVDSYKTCSFGCVYCFSNNRVICEFEKNLQVGSVAQIEKRLHRIFVKKEIDYSDFLDVLVSEGITWHYGGMSDPFQYAEKRYGITRQIVDVCNEYGVSILFSTKSDTVYDTDIRPDLHTFQLSVTNIDNRKDIETNVPDIESRYRFYRELKDKGFKVGIRIQPFIPGVASLKIVEKFKDADNFTLEGIKIVPQNQMNKDLIFERLPFNKEDFVNMGLLNLRPAIRLKAYEPFLEYFKDNNIPYSIADNDLRYLGTNDCCCGDRLVAKATSFNTTAMIMKYGPEYAKEQLDEELFYSNCRDCTCAQVFTSNRRGDCTSVQDFFDKRFYRKSSPFSPKFQYFDKNGDQ